MAITSLVRWATEATASFPSRVTIRLSDMTFLLDGVPLRILRTFSGGGPCDPVHVQIVNRFTTGSVGSRPGFDKPTERPQEPAKRGGMAALTGIEPVLPA